MESITLRDVHGLPSEQRHSLESLLKQPLEEGQQVFIMTFRTGVMPTDAARRQAHAEMVRTLDEAQAHARGLGVSPDEADAAVDEVMRHVRGRPN